jgi:hypothetical protein
MHWWPAILGVFLLALAAVPIVALRKPVHITKTDVLGNETSEYRRLRPGGQVAVVAVSLTIATFGALTLAGAIPWTDERVPDEQGLRVLASC